jgi:hypothetical protein
MDLTQKLIGVVVSIAASIRADADTDKSEAVKVILDIDFSGCSIIDALQYAAADRKIAWANGTGRKSVTSLKAGEHIKVMAGAPNRVQVDSKQDVISWMRNPNVPQAEKDAYLAQLQGN